MAARLVEMLGISEKQAEGLLAAANGSVERAVDLYVSSPQPPAQPERAAPQPVAPPAAAAAPAAPKVDYTVAPGGQEIRVRVRSPAGQHDVTVDDHTPLGLFREKLAADFNVGIAPEAMLLKCGFPPKALPNEPMRTLKELGVKKGEAFNLSKAEDQGKVVQGHTDGKYIPPTDSRGSFTRREMPGDNSCLFHACRYVLEDKTTGDPSVLRKQIAEIVRADPGKFTTAFLGSPNEHYAQWIMQKDNWGGAIELSILSALKKVEICALDVQTKRMYRYGEDENYTCRAFVCYNGNHYDAMALAEFGGAPPAKDIVLFSKTDNSVFKKANDFIEIENKKYLAGK